MTRPISSASTLPAGVYLSAVEVITGSVRTRMGITSMWIRDMERHYGAWRDAVLAAAELCPHTADPIEACEARILRHMADVRARCLAIAALRAERKGDE